MPTRASVHFFYQGRISIWPIFISLRDPSLLGVSYVRVEKTFDFQLTLFRSGQWRHLPWLEDKIISCTVLIHRRVNGEIILLFPKERCNALYLGGSHSELGFALLYALRREMGVPRTFSRVAPYECWNYLQRVALAFPVGETESECSLKWSSDIKAMMIGLKYRSATLNVR